MPNLPPSIYGPNHDGLLDPDRPTSRERRSAVQQRLVDEFQRRNNRSPLLAGLQAAADRALGRGKS